MDSALPLIDDYDLRDFFDWNVLSRGKQLQRDGAVKRLRYDPDRDTLEAQVYDAGSRYSPYIHGEKDEMDIWCDCDQFQDGQCEHLAALVLEWIALRDSVGVTASAGSREEAVHDDLAEGDAPPSDVEVASAFDLVPQEPASQDWPATREQLIEDNRQCLQALTMQQMRDLAARRGIRAAGSRRDPILASLAEGLANAENIRAAIQSLTPEARLALDLLSMLAAPGRPEGVAGMERNIQRLLRLYGLNKPALTCLEELSAIGLIFVSESWLRIPLSVYVFVPPDAEFSGSQEGLDVGKKTHKPAYPAPTSPIRPALHMLLLAQSGELKASPPWKADYWGGWPVNPGAKSQSEFGYSNQNTPLYPQPSYLNSETLERLAAELNEEPEKVDYLARLLELSGLWRIESGRTLRVQPLPFARFMSFSTAYQLRVLFSAAFSLDDWSELDLLLKKKKVRLYRKPYSSGNYQNFVGLHTYLRQVVLRWLGLISEGAWAPVERLLRLIHALGLDYSYPYSSQNTWYELGGKRVQTKDFDAWSSTYGRFYRQVLAGPAYWLGLCELAGESGELVAVRLTQYGALVLGQRRDLETSESLSHLGSIRFLPDLQIELDPARASSQAIGLIPLMGTLQVGARRKRPRGETRLLYQLTAAGAARAFSLGWTPENILNVLADSAGPPPDGKALSAEKEQARLQEEFSRHLHLWFENYGRLHLYQEVALVELGDDYALDELLLSTKLNSYLLYIFNKRLVAVRPEGVNDLLSSLEAGGYTPKIVAPGEPPGGD